MQKLVQFVFFKAFLRQFFGLVAQRKEEKLCAFPLFSALLFRKRRQRSLLQLRHRDGAQCRKVGIRTIVRDADGFLVEVDFGDVRIVAYEDLESLRQLDLAYAPTLHKSQGAEYSSVLISVQNIHGRMLNRALFYTAETRAKIRVIVVGDWEAVVRAINTTDTDRRNTALAERINELIKE